MALYIGALFLWLTDKVDKARDLVDKLVKLNKSSVRFVIDGNRRNISE